MSDKPVVWMICCENISISYSDQIRSIPLKPDNFNVRTSSEQLPDSDVPHQRATRNSKAIIELCIHLIPRWGLKTSFKRVVLRLDSVRENVWSSGGWFWGVGVAHFEPLRVYSTVGSSAHWMDGDHSLGGVCMPHIPRLWHVCVSVYVRRRLFCVPSDRLTERWRGRRHIEPQKDASEKKGDIKKRKS